jgi:integrase
MARRVRGLYKRGRVWWCCYKDLNERVIRVSTGTADYDEAIRYLSDRRTEVRAGIEPERKKIVNHTFSELVEEYKKWAERQKCFYSKIHLINQLSDDFGNVLLKNFNTKMLEQYQTKRLNEGKRKGKDAEGRTIVIPNKPATVNRLQATLSHMFTKGYEWEMLSEDTLKRVRKVKLLPENNRRLRYLSNEECQKLISKCDPHLKAIVTTALNTGCRKGEILSLEWEKHIDLKHGFILLDKTKNGDRRELPINDTLRGVLQGLTRRLDVPHVFYDHDTGKPYRDVKRSFKTAVKRAGIRDFHFHDLRHTFASHLVMAGVDLTTVKELLGHKTLTMTLRYAHLAPAHKVTAVAILDKAINGQGSTSQLLHSKAING